MTKDEWILLFEDFWKAWRVDPRRKGQDPKKPASLVWSRIKNPSQELFDTIIEATQWCKRQDDWIKDGGQFIPMARTWLNQARWEAYVEDRGPLVGPAVEDSTPDPVDPEKHVVMAQVGGPVTGTLTLREKYVRHRGIVTERNI